jgi:hypothetical protein
MWLPCLSYANWREVILTIAHQAWRPIVNCPPIDRPAMVMRPPQNARRKFDMKQIKNRSRSRRAILN